MRGSRRENCSAPAPGASKISVLAAGLAREQYPPLRAAGAFSIGLKFRAFIQEASSLGGGGLARTGATSPKRTKAAC